MKEGWDILKAFGKKAFAFFGKSQLISFIMMLIMVLVVVIGKYMLVWSDKFDIRFDQQQKENTEIKSDITKIKESQINQSITQQNIVEELGSVGRKVDKNREAVVKQIEKSNLSTEEKINEIKNLYSTNTEKKNYESKLNMTLSE